MVPPTAAVAGLGYVSYLAFCPEARKSIKVTRVNKSIRLEDAKVADFVDIEDIAEKAAFCRCWNSKNVCISIECISIYVLQLYVHIEINHFFFHIKHQNTIFKALNMKNKTFTILLKTMTSNIVTLNRELLKIWKIMKYEFMLKTFVTESNINI